MGVEGLRDQSGGGESPWTSDKSELDEEHSNWRQTPFLKGLV